MTERTKLVTGGARALTGVLITAAAAAGALLIGTLNFPTVESEPRATQVDTMQTGARELVCAGAFAELGADPSRPDVALPVGRTNVSVSGDGERKELGSSDTDSTSVGGAAVFTGTMSEPLAAAQIQQLDTATLSGTVAGECVEPVNEQWLLGGASMLGYSTTLSLGNPGSVAATVHISVFDENGKIDDQQTSGVIVAPQSQQIISLNGYAPDSERFAVRVTSTGAPVGASLSVSQIDGINPVGAATVTRQVRAETVSVVPGVANEAVGNHGDGDADSFPVRVQAIAPGEAAGTAEVFALSAEGERISLGGSNCSQAHSASSRSSPGQRAPMRWLLSPRCRCLLRSVDQRTTTQPTILTGSSRPQNSRQTLNCAPRSCRAANSFSRIADRSQQR
ncbi:DUF5719 family protein [Leucobacter denitrificans]|uniref:DUF5719 family protein n=1 Tax=Leucobacter denitrificans TaxID=683042 RepID=UPI001FE32930|nr:DUF5719 family protein [Leucobacter denitrificans]